MLLSTQLLVAFAFVIVAFNDLPTVVGEHNCYRYKRFKESDGKAAVVQVPPVDCRNDEYCVRFLTKESFSIGEYEGEGIYVYGACADKNTCDLFGSVNKCIYGEAVTYKNDEVKDKKLDVKEKTEYLASCCCKGNLCNAASTSATSIALLTAALLVGLLVRRLSA